MLYVPVVVFLFGSRGPDPGTATAIVAGLLLLAAAGVTIHVALSPEPAFRVLMLGVVTTALTAAAAFGVFFLVSSAGAAATTVASRPSPGSAGS
jgi:hypothetical protein